MTKLVNLDELTAPIRKLQFKGESHDVIDLPVDQFVAFQKDFGVMMEAQEKGDMSTVLDCAYRIITACVPTFKDAKSLNMRQLMATVELISDFYPSADEAAGGAGNA